MKLSAIQLKQPIEAKKHFRYEKKVSITCDIISFGVRLDTGHHVYFVPWTSIIWAKKGDDEIISEPSVERTPNPPKSQKGTKRKSTRTPRKDK